MTSLVEARGVSMAFPGVRALDGVDFDVRPGEVHALIGENGAGKSTLIKILSGELGGYGGEVRVDGIARRMESPREAIEAGIAVIPQELQLVSSLSVAENIFLGRPRALLPRAPQALADLGETHVRGGRARRAARGRAAAACGDRAGARARRAADHHGRADDVPVVLRGGAARAPHPAADRARASRSSTSPTSSTRCGVSRTGSRCCATAGASSRARPRASTKTRWSA